MNAEPITRAELLDLLQEQLPTVAVPELGRLATVLHLVLKAGKLAKAAAPKQKQRRYTEKPLAERLHLKRP
ncbi:hypothetical protein Q5H93_02900 [Hymenobacter sp. ASUV-10]|uniref:Transposase n=1 Tax=Hymenobacter aranciens TaxID=3063996 RepID=A0ABT9B5X5_9BACT|nr:hypothetical protein [Hymenobacter sp. ASUV-10]MDO7873667.1 hypothetical protein [Hymenobacter sp. ASUV-10]